jgi:quercetin dioxygenase-like cupin family protein
MKLGILTLMAAAGVLAAGPSAAQPHEGHVGGDPVMCHPRGETPTGALGCLIVANETLGPLPAEPVWWHVYAYPDAAAAREARPAGGTVVEAFGRAFLMVVAPVGWRSRGGERAAKVGPLPVTVGPPSFTATYMEATFTPDMRTRVHTHAGPEAWYMLEGEQCLETPEGTIRAKAGDGMFVRGEIPMMLHAAGQGRRRSLVLVLHDSAKPVSMFETAWRPKGLCAPD